VSHDKISNKKIVLKMMNF